MRYGKTEADLRAAGREATAAEAKICSGKFS